MRLHENWELFSAALQAASQPLEEGGLGIKSIFIEKDYWICRSLSLMAANDKDIVPYSKEELVLQRRTVSAVGFLRILILPSPKHGLSAEIS